VTFRTRVAAAIAVVVAIAVLGACAVAYKTARDALEGSADSTLSYTYSRIYVPATPVSSAAVALPVGGAVGVSLWNPSIGVLGNKDVAIDDEVRDAADGRGGAQFRTTTDSDGDIIRELVVPVGAGTLLVGPGGTGAYLRQGAALILAVGFTGVEQRLRSLGLDLLILAALGVVLSAVFGWLAARTALVPLADTTREIEEVATTLDVSHRMEEGIDDELGRLRRAFNRLLGEVEQSQEAQRRLILDASHELRTPLTSLRANAQVLGRLDELGHDDVTQLSDDMVAQVDELTVLVGQLTELTHGEHSVEEATRFDLADLVTECTEIAETHARTRQVLFEVETSPCVVHARRQRVARAVGNLLDNAIKYSPEGGEVAVTCLGGQVVVEDQGLGIDDADLPKVFDRFYRSPRSRGLPGSGLGLAIVAQVVREAGGSVEAERSERLGGARLVLRLPLAPPA
jgi:two-component system, OmpR family, sensor histidine kinase MprB